MKTFVTFRKFFSLPWFALSRGLCLWAVCSAQVVHGSECAPTEAVRVGLKEVADAKRKRFHTEDWYQATRVKLEDLARRHPSNVFVLRELDAWLYQDAPSRQQLKDALREQARARPEDTVLAYRLARIEVSEQIPAAIPRVEEIVRIDPDFPQARILLATAYKLKPGSHDEHAQIEAFRRLCPQNVEGFRLLIGAPKREFVTRHLIELERQLSAQGPAVSVPHLVTFVALASGVVESDFQKNALARASGWLTDAIRSDRELELDDLELLRSLSDQLSHKEARAFTEAAILRRYPNSVPAWRILDQRFADSRAKQGAGSTDPDGRFARLEHVDSMLRRLPYAPELLSQRFRVLRESREASDGQVLAAGRRLESVMASSPRSDFDNPVSFLVIANELVSRGIGLEDVPRLVNGTLETLARMRMRAEDTFARDQGAKARFLSELDAQEVLGHGLLAQSAALQGDSERASVSLGRSQAVLDRFASVNSSAGASPIAVAALAHHTLSIAAFELSRGDAEASYRALQLAKTWESQTSLGPYKAERRALEAKILELKPLIDAVAVVQHPARTWVAELTPLDNTVFKTVEGYDWSLSEHRGKTLLVNQWASWCGPCKAQLQLIQKLKEGMAGRNDIVFIALSLDDDRQKAKRTLQALGVNSTLLFTDRHRPIARDSAAIVPITFIVDRSGRIRKRTTGFVPAKEWEAQAMDALLSVADGV